MRHKMKCSDVLLRLSAFQDNELNEAMMESVKLHIESCPSCSRELELMESVTASVRSLPADEPADNFTARVMGNIYEKEKKRESKYMPSFVYSLVVIFCFGLGILLNSAAQRPINGQSGVQIAGDSLTQLMDQSQVLSLSQVHESSLEILLTEKEDNDETS